MFYAADHGESINEREHLHGTPRNMAPPEQFRVPMLVWMSDKYLASPQHAQMFAHLKQQAEIKVPRRHVELYDTIMGCPGIHRRMAALTRTTTGAIFPMRRKSPRSRLSADFLAD